MYEIAYYSNDENIAYDRFSSRKSALRLAHELAFKGFSSVITDVETGEVVDEVIIF